MSFDMDIDETSNNDSHIPLECDSFPPFFALACATSNITFGPTRRKTIIVPRIGEPASTQDAPSSSNYYLVIGRVKHEGKSPVHFAHVAEGPSPARSRIRPTENAVKIYPMNVLQNAGRLGTEDPIKEMRVLQFLKDRHDNILSIAGCYQNYATGEMFLDMPLFCQGDGLDLLDANKHKEEGSSLPMPLAKKAIRDLLSALSYLHEELGITHHDISPEQLLYDEESNRFVLIDFGMCIRQARNPTTGDFEPYPHPHFCGKRGYWAPEIEMQSDSPSLNPTKRDIWSLGPTLVMLLTGEKLRDLAQRRGLEMMNYFLSISEHVHTVTRRFEFGRGEEFHLAMDFVAQVMRYRPEDRPTASELLRHPWLMR